jgi:CDGSH-type Zn-finger protein
VSGAREDGGPVFADPRPTSRVEIRVRKNGAYLVTGDVSLVDHEGNPIAPPAGKPNIALCRCGHSAKKPFCDGTHKTCGFADPPDGGGTVPHTGVAL